MGSAFKQTFTKPLPIGAEVVEQQGQRFACWTDRRGRKRKERVTVGRDGSLRLLLVSRTHVIKYRDGSGIIRKEGTGCRDRRAAESLLADRHARAELVKANVISPKQAAVSDHARSTNVEHLDSYVMHLRAKGASAGRVPQVKARLKRLFTECGFSRLADITPDKLTEWLVLQKGLGMSAATRNGYRVDAVSFCNWCRRTHRIEANPLLDVPTAKVNTDRRHIRRALAVEEVQRLITTAAIRTVAEYGRDRVKTKPEPGKAKRSNWTYAPLTPENIQAALRTGTATLQDRPELLHQLRRQGRERALIYKTLYLTGLRLNELRSIKLCQVELTRDGGFIHLRAQDEKNRQGNSIDVPRQLAADLRDWLDERLAELQQQQRMKVHESVPDRLPSDDPLFHIPTGLIRIIDRDLAAAGIAKLDERGHVFDIHAFRTTLNSHLAKQKIPQGVAQRIMRHSKPELTANHYTDMKYLDTAGAVSQLPIIDLNATVDAVARTVAATGTAGAVAPLLVPTLVPDGYKHSPFLSSADQPPGGSARTEALSRIAVSADSVKGKPPVTSAVTGGQEKRVKGVEPSTFTLATCIN